MQQPFVLPTHSMSPILTTYHYHFNVWGLQAVQHSAWHTQIWKWPTPWPYPHLELRSSPKQPFLLANARSSQVPLLMLKFQSYLNRLYILLLSFNECTIMKNILKYVECVLLSRVQLCDKDYQSVIIHLYSSTSYMDEYFSLYTLNGLKNA